MRWLTMSIGLAAGASAALDAPLFYAHGAGAAAPSFTARLRDGAPLPPPPTAAAPLQMRSVFAPARPGEKPEPRKDGSGRPAPVSAPPSSAPRSPARASLRAPSAPDLSSSDLSSSGASSPSASSVSLSGAAGLALAERLFEDGRLDEAEAILSALRGTDAAGVDRTQVTFLIGMIAVSRGAYARAVEAFRDILDRRPELIRVRLELARALFALRRDQAAAYHFRLALADGLPEATKANIRMFLDQIQARKVWRVNAQFGVAPDSNVNAGPRDRAVELFGLPFQLDDEALERSGFGLASSLNASYFPRISRRWRAELRAGGSMTDYENIQFDDAFVFAEAGPRFERPGMSVSALGAVSRRYFGGEGFTTSIGGKMTLAKGLNSRTWATMRFSGAHLDYDDADFRDGPVYSAGLTLRRALNRLSTAQIGVTVTREQTDDQVLRNTQYLTNASYSREFPYGLTVQAGPELYYRRFDNEDPINVGVAFRRDWTYGGSVFVTKRDWRVGGFAPIVSYQYLYNDSNVARFDFTRHRANIGLTRTF